MGCTKLLEDRTDKATEALNVAAHKSAAAGNRKEDGVGGVAGGNGQSRVYLTNFTMQSIQTGLDVMGMFVDGIVLLITTAFSVFY